MKNIFKLKWLIIVGITLSLIFWITLNQVPQISPSNLPQGEITLDQKIDYSINLASYKLLKIIKYLRKNEFYPNYTENDSLENNPKIPDGAYTTTSRKYWGAGAFPGLLWKMYELETNPKLKKFWQQKAIFWSKPLRQQTENNVPDMAINSLFVFKPWYDNSEGKEKKQQLQTILKGATYLAQPVINNQGRFYEDIGVIGYYRKADRTDKKKHWQAFMDHTINVEQLLWAADHNSNLEEAESWRKIAIIHLKTLAKNMGKNRNPGEEGTWQRGYFEDNINDKNYGQFLFNEGKQGWKDETTWSRGQAWWIYANSTCYQYTKNLEILKIAKEAINYYWYHLPANFSGKLKREDDFIPPWDFDYALQVNPDTEKDTSAAAIATSGILNLIDSLSENDPERKKYLIYVENTLNNLTNSTYMTAASGLEMSILRHGSYHHYESIKPTKIYDNGLIWGDYFFLDALQKYQKLKMNN